MDRDVPKRITGFLQNGEISSEPAHRSAVAWVEKVYRVGTGF